MSDDLTFTEHSRVTVASSKIMTGRILRALKLRELKVMMTIFKALVLSELDYCCVLRSPFKSDKISDLENEQRSFIILIGY